MTTTRSSTEIRQLQRKIVFALTGILAVIVIGVIGFTLLGPEDTGLLEIVYFVVITLTTVGYGETLPVHDHPALMVFTILLMMFGTGFLLFALTTITATLVELRIDEVFRRRRMERKIAALRNHEIVCGGGRIGTHIVEELIKTRSPFVLIERDREQINVLLEHHPDILYIEGDAADDERLEMAGVTRAHGLCAALRDDRDNLYLTLGARALNPSLRIVARGVGPYCQTKLRTAGADVVVSSNAIGGLRMAAELLRPNTVGFLDRMLRDDRSHHRFGDLPVPAGSPLAGKTIREVPLRDEGILVIAVRKADGEFEYVPSPDQRLEPGSHLVVLAGTDKLAAMRAKLLGDLDGEGTGG